MILLDDDKIKQVGYTTTGYKTTKTHNVGDMTLNGQDMNTRYGHDSVKQQIDTVDENGEWSYFHYFVDRIDQFDRDQWAMKSGNHHCVGVDFKTIAEYTACNPELFQQLKDKWVYDGGAEAALKVTILNEIVPVIDGHYHIEVKEFKGSQHGNSADEVTDRYKEYVMVTQKNGSSSAVPADIAARHTATGAEEDFQVSTITHNGNGFFNALPVFANDVWRLIGTTSKTIQGYDYAMSIIEVTPNPTTDSQYVANDFRMYPWNFNQTEQNKYAKWKGLLECKDKDFKTLVSWMGCVGADFAEDFQTYLKRLNVNHSSQYTSVLRVSTLGADGVWQLHISQHVWTYYAYKVTK